MRSREFLGALIPLLAYVLLDTPANATEQYGDFVLYKGREHEMCTTPLEVYLDSLDPRPEFELLGSACWRGYVARWKIEANELLLLSINKYEIDDEGKTIFKPMPLTKVFSDKKAPIRASWYTGVLRIPQGKMLRYVHMGFGSYYEKNIYITVKAGKVTAESVVDNTKIGATRSDSDLQWVALGANLASADDPAAKPSNERVTWHDARSIRTPAFRQSVTPGVPFTTRGILSTDLNGPELWIPDTPMTEAVRFVLRSFPKEHGKDSGAHAEVVASYEEANEIDELVVHKVRLLEPGETIHQWDFKPPAKLSKPAQATATK